MKTIPCLVCEYPVEIETAERKVFVDVAQVAHNKLAKTTVAVCGNPRCRRLLQEVLDEQGRQQVDL